MPLDDALLIGSAKMISLELGSLDDLPIELRDTVANVYYRFLKPSAQENSGDLLADLEKHGREHARKISDGQHIGDMIKALRAMRDEEAGKARGGELVIYELFAQVMVDELKYQISNASKKSAVRRWIERQFKVSDDIPNLYVLMGCALQRRIDHRAWLTEQQNLPRNGRQFLGNNDHHRN